MHGDLLFCWWGIASEAIHHKNGGNNAVKIEYLQPAEHELGG